MKSHKQISQRPKKSMKIPLGKLILIRQGSENSNFMHNQLLSPLLNPPFLPNSLSQVILHYEFWLTCIHIGNFRDIPLIEVSVEG